MVKHGKQAIVLVPESALTPQTVRRFTQRFGRVAILHSGLTATERAPLLAGRSAPGWPTVVVGRGPLSSAAANSASSSLMKSMSVVQAGPGAAIHARDVAIKRGQLESVPVVLGSATPSLESYQTRHRASNAGGTRVPFPALLRLPSRCAWARHAHVELVDMRSSTATTAAGVI